MTHLKRTTYYLLYAFTIILALLIRFINLGSHALTDYEANWALQALHLSQGSHALLGSQTAYLQLTAFFFDLFGSTTFVARIVPSLFGCLLVLIPILLQSELGPIFSLILAFFIAIDPGLLAVSRSVGSPVIALACLGLALTFWYLKKPRLAGIFLGLGLLGGSSFWAGVVGIGISLGALRLIDRSAFKSITSFFTPAFEGKLSQPTDEEAQPDDAEQKPKRNPWWSLVIFAAGTAFLTGTLVFIRPAGITGLAGGLTDYLTGWLNSSGISPTYLLLALVIYEPIALILGIWGGLRGWKEKDPLAQFLGLWALISLLLALLYRGREVDSLVWTILPLWCLAVWELTKHFSIIKEELTNTFVQALFAFLLLGFAWLNLEGMVAGFMLSSDNSAHLVTILVALVVLLLASFLISWGWSPHIAEHGLVWGVGLFLLLYTFSASIEAGNLRSEFTSELWNRGQSLPQINLVINTLNQLSDTTTGTRNDLDIDVVGIQSSGLEWALHSFSKVSFLDGIEQGSKPAIVITVDTAQPTLAASYSGNRMLLLQKPDWASTFTSSQFLPWVVFHTAPQTTRLGIIWARVDLFPGGSANTTTNTTK